MSGLKIIQSDGRHLLRLTEAQWLCVRRIRALTDRQASVMRELVEGRTLEEAAARIAIHPGTAKAHLRAVYRKLHVGSRPELVLAVIAALQGERARA